MHRWKLVVLSGLLFCGLVRSGSAQEVLAITHVTVIDVVGSRSIADQTVVIGDGVIRELGRADRIAVPKGATILDGAGRYLIPGLWDMHVHGTGIPHFSELYIANGVTGIRDMFSYSMGSIKAERTVIAGGMAGPRIVAAGRIIDGPKPIWPGSVTAKDAEEGTKAVETVKSEGSDFVKVYSLLPRDAYFAIAQEAKRQGMVFAGHVPDQVTAAEASDAGQKSIEHLTGVLSSCCGKESELREIGGSLSLTERTVRRARLAIDGYDVKKARALFARFRRNRTWMCPTLVVLHNISYLNDPALQKDSRKSYMPAYATSTWNPKSDFRFKDVTDAYWSSARELFRRDLGLVRDMRSAGVEFLAGTDTLNPFCLPGFSLHDELAYLVQAGLSPMEALQSATINAARYLNIEGECGAVAHGKAADLVLLDADPLKDIHNTSKIRAVIRAGRVYNRTALDSMLAGAAAAAGGPVAGPPNPTGFYEIE